MLARKMLRTAAALTLTLTLTAVPAIAADKPAPPPPEKPAEVVTLDVEGFDKARAGQRVITLDVRTEQEFVGGHVPGAVNIPISGPTGENFDKAVNALPKDWHILVYCRSGVRSAKAVEKMKTAGFTRLSVFPGGWVAWDQAGKPSEKGRGGDR
jgi:rhodanese-related sulfurtransferase